MEEAACSQRSRQAPTKSRSLISSCAAEMGLRRTLGSMRPLHPRINLKRTQRWGPCVRRAVFPIRLSSLPSRSLSGAASRVCESRSTRAATAISHAPCPISDGTTAWHMANTLLSQNPTALQGCRMCRWVCLLLATSMLPGTGHGHRSAFFLWLF